MSQREPPDSAISFAHERDAPPVEAQSRVEVHCWRLLRAPSGSLHLVTLRSQNEEGGTVRAVRVTSAITSVDEAAGVVMTSSGRQYRLIAPFETRDVERDLLHRGAATLGMGDSVDVSVLAWDQVHIG